MNKIILIYSVIFFNIYLNAQTTYYVDQNKGDDTNNGIKTSTAFKTIDKATSSVKPGDTISIIGVYANSSYSASFSYTNNHDPHLWHKENSIKINDLNGTSTGYITIKAFDNNTILKGDGDNILRIINSSYLRIEDFNIEGEVPNIPLSTANALQFVYIDVDNTKDPNDPLASEILYRDQDCISNCTAGAVVDGEIYTDISKINVNRPSYIDTRGVFFKQG